ncbi:MAG: glycosyltransferase family 9 protein [Alphaproteobacteria bacterium]|nr:glycosyltransferase family 9 protein [Alphaproteobacteria bacterium]
MRRVLVIRYGGFGDIAMSMGLFRTIRAHHDIDHVTALTTPPFAVLLAQSGYFDEIVADPRSKLWQMPEWLRFAHALRERRFDRVYDLQRNRRTALLYRALSAARALEWSGVVPGCSHFVADRAGDHRHAVDKLVEQLEQAGIERILPPELGWLRGEAGSFGLPHRYALMVPGGAPHRPEKRAPAERFAALARYWVQAGIAPAILGTASERAQIDAIRAGCEDAIDLSDRTGFGDIAELARGAVGAIGNDTGAMHLIAGVGCPSLVLFSGVSEPDEVCPRGARVRVLRREPLASLETGEVIAAWEGLLR